MLPWSNPAGRTMQVPGKAIFVGATKQHVGKSSSCLGIVQAAKERFGRCGFMKPVGQRHVLVGSGGLKVDKDVKLFKEYFRLDDCAYADMSPVVMPQGYTKDYIDGKISVTVGLQVGITKSFNSFCFSTYLC